MPIDCNRVKGLLTRWLTGLSRAVAGQSLHLVKFDAGYRRLWQLTGLFWSESASPGLELELPYPEHSISFGHDVVAVGDRNMNDYKRVGLS